MNNDIHIGDADYLLLRKIKKAEDKQVADILFSECGANAASFIQFLEQEGLMNDPDALTILKRIEELETQSFDIEEPVDNVEVSDVIGWGKIDFNQIGEFSAHLSYDTVVISNLSSSWLSSPGNEVFFPNIQATKSDRVFKELYRVHASPLLRYVLIHTRNEETAKDIVQKAFVQIWIHLSDIQSLRQFSSSLLGYAKTYINAAGRAGRRRRDMENTWLFPSFTENDAFLEPENILFLVAEISELPKPVKEVIIYYLKGMEIKEIAAVMGLPTASVEKYREEAKAIFGKKAKSRSKKR